MSTGLFNNGIIDYDGSIPGAQQGDSHNRPAAGKVIGDWYLALNAQKLYQWDGTNWVLALDGSGGGGGADWETVMSNGNVSSISANIVNGIGQRIASMGPEDDVVPGALGGYVAAWSPGAVPFGIGAGIGLVATDASGTWKVGFTAQNTLGGWLHGFTAGFEVITLARRITFTDADGDVQVSGNGLKLPSKAISANYAANRGDYTLIVDTTGGSIIIDLPTGIQFNGQIFNIKVSVITANTITLHPASGNIDGAPTASMSCLALNSMQVQFDGTNYWII